MFGMSFMEILIVAVIAVLFLGPDKLPEALVKVAKFFKSFKGSINEAKSSFEQELKIQELREESLKYKKKLEESTSDVRKKLTFDELEDLKNDTTASVNRTLDDIKNDISIDAEPAKMNKKSTPKKVAELKEKAQEEPKKESDA